MAANQNATFYVYENAGLGPGDRVTNKDADFYVYENAGIGPGDKIADKDADFYVYENAGLGPNDYGLRQTGTKGVAAWGVTPSLPRDFLIYPSSDGGFYVYENDVDL